MNFQETWYFFLLVLCVNMIVEISNAQIKDTATTSGENATLPTVTITQGTLQGINLVSRNNRSISAFLGIPYGQPPIGNLRFSSPVAADGWNDTFNASIEGNPCPQPENIGDEDCLYLNVYTLQVPENNDSSLLPVMVFVHGGRFERDSGRSDLYGPGHLLDEDVVLVAINYRLGPFGFLSTGDEVATGNWGLKDQVLALQWVQKNIANFGGDPNQVTVFGQSAGGTSVQLLALSDSTIGLFHKFISQSGAAIGFWAHRPRSTYANLALQLGEMLDCPTNSSSLLVDCLRRLNASEILNTRSQFYLWNQYPDVLWGPTDEPDIDGAFLTDSPANLLAAGKIRDLPSMTGIVKDEGTMYTPGLPDTDTLEEFLNNFDELLPIMFLYSDQVEDVPSFTAALKKFYFNNDLTTNQTQVWSNVVALFSDALFVYPVYSALQKQLAFAENATFFYSFEYRGTYSISDTSGSTSAVLNDRVCHGDQNLYLFPQAEARLGVLPGGMSETDLQVIDTMVQLWTSFAINGTPTTTATISNTTWGAYSTEDNYLRIGSGSEGTVDLQYGFLQERMQFWNELTATGSGNTVVISPFLQLIFVLLLAYPKMPSLVTNI